MLAEPDERVTINRRAGDSGHFRLRLLRFTPTRFAFEIARKDHKYVEVTYDLDAQRFDEVRRIVHIIFGVQG